MTKTANDEVLEFFQSFLAGSESQDFRPWAREVYQKLYRASAEPNGDHDIPTDGQLLDQLQDAFYKADSGYVEQDVQLRKDLANLLVRYNAENRS